MPATPTMLASTLDPRLAVHPGEPARLVFAHHVPLASGESRMVSPRPRARLMPATPATDSTSATPSREADAFATRAAAETPRASVELDRLMDRYAAGDLAAFTELHRQLAPRLHGFLTRLGGKLRLADDLLQDTFLRMHRARGSFSPGAAVVPWAYAVARNVYIDHTRKGRERRTDSIEDLPPGTELVAEAAGSPDADMAAKETLDLVRVTLEKLPQAQREAFILIRFEGLRVAEAAEVLGASEANVKVRAFRAYEAFRQALKLRQGDEAR